MGAACRRLTARQSRSNLPRDSRPQAVRDTLALLVEEDSIGWQDYSGSSD
jgi:hypothetical protein